MKEDSWDTVTILWVDKVGIFTVDCKSKDVRPSADSSGDFEINRNFVFWEDGTAGENFGVGFNIIDSKIGNGLKKW